MTRVRVHRDRAFWFCPGCRSQHNVAVGPLSGAPEGERWSVDVATESLNPSVRIAGAGIPSAHLGPYVCHATIEHGRAVFESESTHWAAGCSVELPDLPA